MTGGGVLRVSPEDMELFARASHDRNPLHTSPEYARRTPFGEPVVFGALAALRAMQQVPLDGAGVAKLSLEFKRPLYVGRAYRLDVEREGDGASFVVRDLGAPALEGRVMLGGDTEAALAMPGDGAGGRLEPARHDLASLPPGFSASGRYAPSDAELRLLLGGEGPEAALAAVLLWASYVVGMELPGERATFWRLRLGLAGAIAVPFDWTATVGRRDERVGLVELAASLSGPAGEFATASLSAFVRGEVPRADAAELRRLLPAEPALAGTRAVVIGGSRGLGAALSQALALQGADVLITFAQSAADAAAVAKSVDGPGSIEAVRGDARDAAWCAGTLRPLVAERGGADVVICNAAPPIGTLPFAPEAVDRAVDFLGESVRVVASPLAALAPDVAERGGTFVVVSSTALDTLPPEWPHYVMAKSALEGLARWLAARYPAARVVVVRPAKLLTDQMNTLLGRQRAGRVEPVAAAVVARLVEARAGGVEVFEPVGGEPSGRPSSGQRELPGE